MTRRLLGAAAAAALWMARPAAAQSPLALSDAIARATADNPGAKAAVVAEHEADERVRQARAGYFPRVSAEEAWLRGNQPAFVFSSRLAQRQLTAADFELDALAHPPVLDSFRTTLSVEQTVFDRRTPADVRAASLGRSMAASRRQIVEQDLTAAVTDAFGAVLVATATVRSTAAAVDAAQADRRIAANRRDVGRATEADVLQLDVYLARALERQVQAASDERIARARLNQIMGEPLGTRFSLDAAPPVPAIDVTDASSLEAYAVSHRPDVALAAQSTRLATTAVTAARAEFLPRVLVQGEWELNGDDWRGRAASWAIGATVRLNLFDGFADRARLAEARAQARHRALEHDQAESMARLDVRIALAQLEAARATEAVGRAAVEQARESRRIIRDRYESGLADVSLLLRSADAIQQAEAQRIAAQVNVLTATAHLQRALGR